MDNVSLACDLFSEKIPDTVLVCCVAIIPKSNYTPLWLSASIRFNLPLQAGVDIRRG